MRQCRLAKARPHISMPAAVRASVSVSSTYSALDTVGAGAAAGLLRRMLSQSDSSKTNFPLCGLGGRQRGGEAAEEEAQNKTKERSGRSVCRGSVAI